MDLRVLAIAVGNFVTACGAFVVVGLLNEIAADLNVSVAVAGLLGAGFAGASAVLAPIAGILGSRISRRALLVGALGVNVLSSLGSALAPNFATLMAFRMLLGGSVGAYIPAAVTAAGMIVPVEQRGRAIFTITLGVSVAQVFGVPVGVWFGGFAGWRATFLLFGVVGAIVCMAQWRMVPADLHSSPFDRHSWRELRRNRAILITLLVSALQACGGMLTLTYLAPLLRDSLDATPNTISIMLGLFGFSGVVGSFIGIRTLDRVGPQRLSVVALALIIANFAIWQVAHDSLLLTAIAVCLWGAGFIMVGTAQQTRLVMISPKLAPVSVAFNTSCVFGGSAIGAAIGSATIAYAGLGALTWASLGIVCAALAILLFTRPTTGQRPSDAH